MQALRLLAAGLCLLLGASASDAENQNKGFGFDRFPVSERYHGHVAAPKLRSRQDQEFRSVLKAAARQAPNFAGHFILTNVGCGASCVMTAVLDAKSGNVEWLPFTLCCWAPEITEPVDFRLDSDLIVLHGRRNEHEAGTWKYRFTNGSFQPVP